MHMLAKQPKQAAHKEHQARKIYSLGNQCKQHTGRIKCSRTQPELPMQAAQQSSHGHTQTA